MTIRLTDSNRDLSNPKTYVPIAIGLTLLFMLVLGFGIATYGIPLFVISLGMMLVAIMWFRPELTFTLYWICMLALGPGFPLASIGSVQLNAMDVILVIGVIKLLSARVGTRQSIWQLGSEIWFFIIFFLIATLTGISQQPLELVMRDMRPFIYMGVTWFWVSLLAKHFDVSRLLIIALSIGSFLALTKAWLINANILSLETISPSLIQANSVYYQELGATRTMLFGIDTLLPSAIPLFLSQLLYGKVRYRNPKAKILLWIGLASAGGTLFLGFTRSAWLGTLIGILFVGWMGVGWSGIQRRIPTILTGLIFGIVMVVVVEIVVRTTSDLSAVTLILNRLSGNYDIGGGLGGLNYRLRESQAMWMSLKNSPILGKGFGGTFYFQDFGLRYIRELTWTHAGWSWLFLKGGLVGVVLVLYPFYRLTRKAWSKWGKKEFNGLMIGLLAAIAALAFVNFSRNTFAAPEGGALLGAWLGLLMIIGQDNREYNAGSS